MHNAAFHIRSMQIVVKFVSIKKRSNTHSSVRGLFYAVDVYKKIQELRVQKSAKRDRVKNRRKIVIFLGGEQALCVNYCSYSGKPPKRTNWCTTPYCSSGSRWSTRRTRSSAARCSSTFSRRRTTSRRSLCSYRWGLKLSPTFWQCLRIRDVYPFRIPDPTTTKEEGG
jgi:hypothetical protein